MIQIRRRTLVLAGAALLTVTAIAVTALLVALGRPVTASDRFPDVASGSAFHDEVGWLTDPDHPIATGFPDGTFRPREDINRQQAAFWFANYNDSLTVHTSNTRITGSSDFRTGVDCPAGKRPLVGWGDVVANGKAVIIGMDAHNRVGLDDVDWYVDWDPAGTVSQLTVDTFVLCAPETLD